MTDTAFTGVSGGRLGLTPPEATALPVGGAVGTEREAYRSVETEAGGGGFLFVFVVSVLGRDGLFGTGPAAAAAVRDRGGG